ncbi:MAG: PDZ domain-containing protein [Planctomycetota bacterium]|nr:MAG: PDZ domain-containing protein [Planctomycetota bacterium]
MSLPREAAAALGLAATLFFAGAGAAWAQPVPEAGASGGEAGASGGEADPPADPAADPEVVAALRRAYEALLPAVVRVEALGGLPPGHRAPRDRAGARGGVLVRAGFKQANGPSTGLVVSADGLVATSTFVLRRRPEHLFVTLRDGRTFLARLVGRDEAHGVALLRVPAQGLPAPRFAESAGLLPGRFAFALGLGLGTKAPTLSLGIVSGLRRIGGRALQTSAHVSPANYGGPLAALDGSVLGLLVPLGPRGEDAAVELYDSGIGFAVPAPRLKAIVARLRTGTPEEVVVLRRGFAGLALDPKHRGPNPRIAGVLPGSPAAKAGLSPGEFVRSVDGRPTAHAWQVRHALARRYRGDRVVLEVEGAVGRRSVELVLGAPPAEASGAPGAAGVD